LKENFKEKIIDKDSSISNSYISDLEMENQVIREKRKRSRSTLQLQLASSFVYSNNKQTCGQWRIGKWTKDEEAFASQLIAEFEAGTLKDCEEGKSLRSYLSKKLQCTPMRISKKFAGQCIGKVCGCNKQYSSSFSYHCALF
jgi:hypothetical protein